VAGSGSQKCGQRQGRTIIENRDPPYHVVEVTPSPSNFFREARHGPFASQATALRITLHNLDKQQGSSTKKKKLANQVRRQSAKRRVEIAVVAAAAADG